MGIFRETRMGDSGDNLLLGDEGVDAILGGAGNDTLAGGWDSDTLTGDAGNDVFTFRDINEFRKTESFINPFGGRSIRPSTTAVTDYITDFNAGTDKLDFSKFDIDPDRYTAPKYKGFTFIGNAASSKADGSSQLYFDTQSQNLFGDIDGDGVSDFTLNLAGVTSLSKSDFLFYRDSIVGGALAETLSGQDGNDTLIGGGGADVLTGGWGADQFTFKEINDFRSGSGSRIVVDTITDFTVGIDKLDFRNFDADATDGFSATRFRFMGTNVVLKNTGFAQMSFRSSDGMIIGDTNGDGNADLALKLTGVTSLSWGDFRFA